MSSTFVHPQRRDGLRCVDDSTMRFRAALGFVLNQISPTPCAGCEAPSEELFCPACRIALEPGGVTRAGCPPIVTLGEFGGPLQTAVHRLKYEGQAYLADRIGLALATVLADHPPHVVLSVPVHRRRAQERGYDQAALIAKALGRRLGWQRSPMALGRIRHTEAQATLDRDARQENVRGAFAARSGLRFSPDARIALVDDVLTTGATLRACQSALEGRGGTVSLWIVAATAVT